MSYWTPTRCFRLPWPFSSCCQHFCQLHPPERASRFENGGAAHSINHSRGDHSTTSAASDRQYKSRGQPDLRERGIDPTSCQRATKNFLFSIHHHNDHMAYLVCLYKVQNRQDESTAIDMWIVVGWGWGWTEKEYKGIFSGAGKTTVIGGCQLRGCICICQNSPNWTLNICGF